MRDFFNPCNGTLAAYDIMLWQYTISGGMYVHNNKNIWSVIEFIFKIGEVYEQEGIKGILKGVMYLVFMILVALIILLSDSSSV